MQRGQRTFTSEYYEDGPICNLLRYQFRYNLIIVSIIEVVFVIVS